MVSLKILQRRDQLVEERKGRHNGKEHQVETSGQVCSQETIPKEGNFQETNRQEEKEQ